ncbi:MAG: cyclic nucleotide-binding domain-containing protein [Magnetococcales bacterium]|nr:cyclic nucleotide-binding domain-containing protein [Magnetococcales bacterium]
MFGLPKIDGLIKGRRMGRHYNDGEVIFRQGEQGDQVFSVQEGEVEVMVESPGGCGCQRIAVLKAGDLFGLGSLVKQGERCATARAKGGAWVLTLDRATLIRQLHTDPSLAFSILSKTLERLQALANPQSVVC